VKTRCASSAFLAIVALSVVPSARAASLFCSGTIPTVLVDVAGSVMIRPTWRNDYVTICSLVGGRNGIDGVTCAVWYSMAQNAINTQQPTTTYFPNTSAANCMGIGTYDLTEPVSYFLISH